MKCKFGVELWMATIWSNGVRRCLCSQWRVDITITYPQPDLSVTDLVNDNDNEQWVITGFLGERVRNMQWLLVLPGPWSEPWLQIAGEVSHSCVSCLGGTDDEMDLDQGDMVTSESECENCGQVPAWIIRVWVDNFGLFLLQLSLAQHLVPACAHLNRIIMLSLNLWFAVAD